MKKLLFFGLILAGCNERYAKPFIVIHKLPQPDDKRFEYIYVDANGKLTYTYELTDKYNIGDTIR